jgi:hypothetical protein
LERESDGGLAMVRLSITPNKTGGFFGFSYTSPTPTIFTTQQLGLGITKAFATHIKNAEKRSSLAPALQTAELEAQDSLSIGSFA